MVQIAGQMSLPDLSYIWANNLERLWRVSRGARGMEDSLSESFGPIDFTLALPNIFR